MSAEDFVDTNVLLYLLSADTAKADRAEAVFQAGGVVSVQVLNEFTAVARRKLKLGWQDVADVLDMVQSTCGVESLTLEGHTLGRELAVQYGFSVYDAMIVASALVAGCTRLYTEDLQHGLQVRGQLRVCNPFADVQPP